MRLCLKRELKFLSATMLLQLISQAKQIKKQKLHQTLVYITP